MGVERVLNSGLKKTATHATSEKSGQLSGIMGWVFQLCVLWLSSRSLGRADSWLRGEVETKRQRLRRLAQKSDRTNPPPPIPHPNIFFFRDLTYLFVKERERELAGRGAKGKKECPAGSVLNVEPDGGHDLMTLR